MRKKRLPKLDPPTKPFKVAGIPSGLVELFNSYIEIKARQENKTEAQAFEDLFLPIVTEGFTKKWVDRSLRIYNSKQKLIRQIHDEAAENTPK